MNVNGPRDPDWLELEDEAEYFRGGQDRTAEAIERDGKILVIVASVALLALTVKFLFWLFG